jgi:hypothetical protein
MARFPLEGRAATRPDSASRFSRCQTAAELRGEGDTPVAWSGNGRSIFIYRPGELPAKIFRLDLASGQKQLWKQLMPADSAGVTDIGPILITPDAKTYVYEYGRTLSDLYLVDGLK